MQRARLLRVHVEQHIKGVLWVIGQGQQCSSSQLWLPCCQLALIFLVESYKATSIKLVLNDPV
jgi:hypothetical protein